MRKSTVVAGPLTVTLLLLTACASRPTSTGMGGTAWGAGAFDSNGERIYFTATSDRGTPITYTGGPASGMMMMGGNLACASCHGPDGRGGTHTMHMQVMEAPDIRWSVLAGQAEGEHAGETESETGHAGMEAGYDFDIFRLAVVEGQHPDGTALNSDMPRWTISDDDLKDLMDYLKRLP